MSWDGTFSVWAYSYLHSTKKSVACIADMFPCDIFLLSQLKEVRREVELSRRRSIKLKAQVDKLQENRDGLGWSQHRERVKAPHSSRTKHTCRNMKADCNVLLSTSFTGHRRSFVCSAAAAPTNRVRVQSARPLQWGKPAGPCSVPAAECGP